MFSENIIKKTFQCGALDYPLSKILNIIDVDESDYKPLSPEEIENYKTAFNTEGSEIWNAYVKGQDVRDFAFDSKLFEMGRAGDVKAMKMFEDRKKRKILRQE